MHDIIKKRFGGDIAVLARTPAELRNMLARNPFRKADTTKLHFTLLAAKPEASRVREFLAAGYAPDKVKVIGDAAYVLCATRYSDLKANNNFIERKLGVAATTRVYDTIAKLIELSVEG